MKVKELIEILQGFDQEKNIWILYDTYDAQVPDFIECAEDKNTKIKTGDYMHEAY